MSRLDLIAVVSLLGISVLLTVGCGSNSDVSTQVEPATTEQDVTPESDTEARAGTDETNAEAASDPSVAVSNEVSVVVKTWEEVQQLIAAQRGKVVVVDLWSTWCGPCMREFPHLVELHNDFPGQVYCISVDLDYIGLEDEPPESFRENVTTFLQKHNATFTNVISADTDEDVFRAAEISSIPAVLVYDREGILQKKFSNDDNQYGDDGFTYKEHIVPLVKQLLEE